MADENGAILKAIKDQADLLQKRADYLQAQITAAGKRIENSQSSLDGFTRLWEAANLAIDALREEYKKTQNGDSG